MKVEDVAYACRTRYGGVMVLRVHVQSSGNADDFLASCMQALLEDGVHPYTVRKLAGVPLQRWQGAWTWGDSPPILMTEPAHVRVMMSINQKTIFTQVSPQLHETTLDTLSALRAFMELHGFVMLDMVNPGCFYTLKSGVIVPLATRGDLYKHGMYIGKVAPMDSHVAFRSLHHSDYVHEEWG